MSQQQRHETNLRRSSRTRNRKSYSDYFSDDDTLTENEDDEFEEQEDPEEDLDDASDDEYIHEEQEASDGSINNDSGEEEEQNEASKKDDFNPKFACGLCSNILSDPYIIPACCHRFCCKCIQQSIKAGIGPCPTCRDHSVSFESLRRDEIMGRLLARYKMLKEKIQKKKIEKRKHQEDSNDGAKATESRTRKKQKRESSMNEKSTKASSDDLSAKAKSSNRKKVATASKNKKRKAKSSNEILTFNERLQCLRDFKKLYGHVNVPRNCTDLSCHEGLGRWCSNIRRIKSGAYKQFTNPEFKLTKKRMKVLEDMGFRWTSIKSFDEYFQEVQAFKEKHGHCFIPKEYKENKQLGSWCARLRLMKAGTVPNSGSYKLTPERIKRLDALGFRWRMKSQPLKKVDSEVAESQEKMEITTKVESVNGNIPTDEDTKKSTSDEIAIMQEKEQTVGEQSIHKQANGTPDDIQEMREGKRKEKSTVPTLKQANDDRNGFNIDKGRKRKKKKKIPYRSFDVHFSALKSFKQKKGHCNVSFQNNTEDPSLMNWISNIRQMKAGRMKPYSNPETKLTKARIAKLDALGFEWTRGPSYHDRIDKFTFDDYVRDLKAYKAKHGDCFVPKTYKNNKKLGRWVSKLRMLRSGTMQPVNHPSLQLTEERIEELNSIGFKWVGWKTFDEYIADLREFKAKHDHCDVPFLYSENKSLGHWVGKLRSMRVGTRKKGLLKYSPHQLTKERIAQLDKMGFNWRLISY